MLTVSAYVWKVHISIQPTSGEGRASYPRLASKFTLLLDSPLKSVRQAATWKSARPCSPRLSSYAKQSALHFFSEDFSPCLSSPPCHLRASCRISRRSRWQVSWARAPPSRLQPELAIKTILTACFYIEGGNPNSTRLPKPLFKRVVIMLVDALREDFVFGPSGRMYMPYTRHLVERGSSSSYVAKARPPTVTMPRIKVRSLSQALFVILPMQVVCQKTEWCQLWPSFSFKISTRVFVLGKGILKWNCWCDTLFLWGLYCVYSINNYNCNHPSFTEHSRSGDLSMAWAVWSTVHSYIAF